MVFCRISRNELDLISSRTRGVKVILLVWCFGALFRTLLASMNFTQKAFYIHLALSLERYLSFGMYKGVFIVKGIY